MRENLPRLATGNPQIEFKLEERFNKHPHILGEYGTHILWAVCYWVIFAKLMTFLRIGVL